MCSWELWMICTYILTVHQTVVFFLLVFTEIGDKNKLTIKFLLLDNQITMSKVFFITWPMTLCYTENTIILFSKIHTHGHKCHKWRFCLTIRCWLSFCNFNQFSMRKKIITWYKYTFSGKNQIRYLDPLHWTARWKKRHTVPTSNRLCEPSRSRGDHMAALKKSTSALCRVKELIQSFTVTVYYTVTKICESYIPFLLIDSTKKTFNAK